MLFVAIHTSTSHLRDSASVGPSDFHWFLARLDAKIDSLPVTVVRLSKLGAAMARESCE